MKGPGYAWRCGVCERENQATAGLCAHCGFPSISTAVEVARARGEPAPVRQGYSTTGHAIGELIVWLIALIGFGS